MAKLAVKGLVLVSPIPPFQSMVNGLQKALAVALSQRRMVGQLARINPYLCLNLPT